MPRAAGNRQKPDDEIAEADKSPALRKAAHDHHHHARATAAKHQAELAHHTPGRVRLKIRKARDNPDLLNQIKEAFSLVPGIEEIEVKPASGSIVIYYDMDYHPTLGPVFTPPPAADEGGPMPRRPPKGNVDELASTIEDEAEFLAEHSVFTKQVVAYCKQLDQHVKRVSGNNLDLKFMVPLGLAAVTFLEIGAAAATPMWITLVIFSLNHFVELHAHDADEPKPQP